VRAGIGHRDVHGERRARSRTAAVRRADVERHVVTTEGVPLPVASPASRWRRVVPTIATVVFATICVLAGNWQRGRWNDKQALAEQIRVAREAPAVSFSRIDPDPARSRFRIVEASGRFDGAHQILLDNRMHAGRPGYHVLTPLALTDGRMVIVNRGFVAAGRTRADVPAAPAPEGDVTIRGRVNLPPPRWLEVGNAQPSGTVWQNFDLARYQAATGLVVLPIVIEQLGDEKDGLVRDWPDPDLGSEKHVIYMVQWYAFGAIAVGLWLYFALRRRS
jgi:surfeit locus 1 family protein